MKIKFICIYLIGFLSLLFLIHECHDWAHFISARIICDCWGTKGFNIWTLCSNCSASPTAQVMVYFAGPFVTYIVIWAAWWLMRRKNTLKMQSLGFALLFAALPFIRILAALAGGSDETYGLRQLFQHANGANRHAVALTGLALIVVLTLPALLRAFLLLKGWKERIFLYAAFLLLPGYIDEWTLTRMTKFLNTGFLGTEIWGTPLLVIAWFILLLIILTLTGRSLLLLLQILRKDPGSYHK